MVRKTIALPGRHDLDIQPILPIINSEIFQRLQYVTQLGLNSLTFISANHTRFEHSLGAYSLMQERANLWLKDGMIKEDEAINLSLFSLLHDIGHGPYSHATEVLCQTDHNQHGFSLIEQLQPEIEKCGGSMPLFRALFKRENPLAVANSHRPLGADKLDYIKRDAYYTSESAGFRMGDLINHVYYIDGKMVADLKFTSEVMQLQMDYINMHDRVYLRKACLITQYFLQQMVAFAIASQDVDQDKLPTMRDFELQAALQSAKDSIVKELFDRVLNRRLPKTAFVLRAKEALTHDGNNGKQIAMFRVDMSQLEKFAIFEERNIAAIHEKAIAKVAGIPAHAVLVTPVAAPHRFIPDDVPLYDNNQVVGTLKDCYPHHYASMKEIATSYSAVRVCVFEEYREKVANTRVANCIFEYLMQLIAKRDP